MPKLIDLSGVRFGKLVALQRVGSSNGNALWLCRCDCGRTMTVNVPNLKSTNTRSCGCSRGQFIRETMDLTHASKSLDGMTFGRLLVIQKSLKRSGTNPMWECLCECGNYTTVIQENLINGHTTSCGCLSSKQLIASLSITHGKSYTRLYRVWASMKARCENPNSEQYPNYGGRGVVICEEWHDYLTFYEWAMSNGYQPDAEFGKCTIDRIDVDGSYTPSNCRWVDMKVQTGNKRKHKL